MRHNGAPVQELKRFTGTDLKALKVKKSREKDPVSGKTPQWVGALLSQVVEESMKGLTVEQKARVDLVILRNDSGQQAQLPRAFLQKYPILLAWQRDREELLGYQSVIPWTSSGKKIREEGSPLESFFLAGVNRIELASMQELFGALMLKRRTDPSAVRGEKLFVQSCVACHSNAQGVQLAPARLEASAHPVAKGMPQFTDKDRRALVSYLEAYRRENPVAGAAPETAKPAVKVEAESAMN